MATLKQKIVGGIIGTGIVASAGNALADCKGQEYIRKLYNDKGIKVELHVCDDRKEKKGSGKIQMGDYTFATISDDVGVLEKIYFEITGNYTSQSIKR